MIYLGIFLSLLVSFFIWVLYHFLDKDFIVKQIESNFNCRVEVGTVRINLFSLFSSIEIFDLKIVSRDEVANQGVPYSKRKPVDGGVDVYVEKLELKVKLISLVKMKLKINTFIFYKPAIYMMFDKEYDDNITPIFSLPAIVDGKPNIELSKEKKEKEPKEKTVLTIKKSPLSAVLDKIGIKNGEMYMYLEKTLISLEFKNLNVMFNDIYVNPDNLYMYNSLNLSFGFQLNIIGKSKKLISELHISCNDNIHPFYPDTGRYNRETLYNLNLEKSSYLKKIVLYSTMPNVLYELAKFGLNFDNIENIENLTNTIFTVTFYRGKLELKKTVNLMTELFALELFKDSWFQVMDNEHYFIGSVTIYKKELSLVVEGVEDFLRNTIKELPTRRLQKLLLPTLVKNDRLILPYISSGNIRSPNVNFSLEIPVVKNLFDGINGTISEFLF
jgi:hypothetical protein